MKQGKEVENPESRFSAVLLAAAKLPGVRINREAYLNTGNLGAFRSLLLVWQEGVN